MTKKANYLIDPHTGYAVVEDYTEYFRFSATASDTVYVGRCRLAGMQVNNAGQSSAVVVRDAVTSGGANVIFSSAVTTGNFYDFKNARMTLGIHAVVDSATASDIVFFYVPDSEDAG